MPGGFASARAASLAAELGLGPSIEGTGRGGAVTVADVRAAAAAVAAPGGLGDAGARLWRSIRNAVAPDFELDEREEAILELACRQADDLALVERVIGDEGAAASGSTGQRVVHPAVQEARQARLAIGRLLGLLDLTEELGSPGAAASIHARRAAQARHRRKVPR